jgi:hypothetical protein
MAKLYITEYATISQVPNHTAQMPLEPPLREQVLDFTGSVQTSQPFQQFTRCVRLHCDAVCSLIISRSSNPITATVNNGRWAANQTEYRGVPEGEGYQVSVINNV